MARKLRNIKLYVYDILNSIEKIRVYIQDLNFEDFKLDSKSIDAVIRNFEIIGEASNHLPIDFKLLHDNISWRALTDFRNVVIHEYFGVNIEIIWDIAMNELPELHSKIKSLYDSMDDTVIQLDY